MKPQSKIIEREHEREIPKFSSSINCRDPHGKLFAVINHPWVPYEVGNLVSIQRKRYIVKGMCMVNKRLNVNFEEVITNDSQRSNP